MKEENVGQHRKGKGDIKRRHHHPKLKMRKENIGQHCKGKGDVKTKRYLNPQRYRIWCSLIIVILIIVTDIASCASLGITIY
jgi:hypothetical protein